MLTAAQIRQSFLDFFREKKHTIVPSSSLMPDSPNLLFTNAGMNQFVPIFLGEKNADVNKWAGAVVERDAVPTRAADTQKCIRAGGKHNDLDDVGLDTYHHTFFEMLGNWSFGDYFKKEAIEWAWELIVERWKFPAQRLYATIYQPDKSLGDPAERDEEAWNFWAEKFRSAGLDPAVHIVNGNKKDNFWMMGETGPCGPCSELHVDLTPAGDTRGLLVNQGTAECIEIWNLVFIQFNANPDGTFSPLPAKHVDTGMGFERVASIIQGTKNFTDFANAKISNYETDIFRPIFDELEKMSGKRYASTLPNAAGDNLRRAGENLVEAGQGFVGHEQSLSSANKPLSEPDKGQSEAQKPLSKPDGPSSWLNKIFSSPHKTPSEPDKTNSGAETVSSEPDKAISGIETASSSPQTTLPEVEKGTADSQIAIDVAFRVIADHIRTLSFAIADGIQPGNTDRNYVLRRILRRAVRYGRTLGFKEPFFYKLVPVLAREMGTVFPELRAKQKHVEEVLKREEEAFNKTLDKGITQFNGATYRAFIDALTSSGADKRYRFFFDDAFGPGTGIGNVHDLARAPLPEVRINLQAPDPAFVLKTIGKMPVISGEAAFELYDTYGFPLDLTELMARERGITVDTAGFEMNMEWQRARARAAQKKQVIELSEVETKTATHFLGYDLDHTGADVQEVLSVKGKTVVIANNSVCYAEMGGQVGDTGEMAHGGQVWRIANTQKSGNTWLHFLDEADAPAVGEHVTIEVDRARRGAIQRHHTVTHLLHWALHEVVSREATQKGSFVGPDKLTFDFNSAALTSQQVREIERLVNERIVENAAVSWNEVPYADVRGRADIMQFFGDKYGDIVRVVDIGGYSKELCAGTHTRATGEIGLFRIESEAAIAAGVRRIEAVAGLSAYDLAASDAQRLHALALKMGTPLPELEKRIDSMLVQQKELEKALKSAQQREATSKARDLANSSQLINDTPSIIANAGAADGDTLQAIADALKAQGYKGVVVLGGVASGSVALVASVSAEYHSKVQAGKLIGAIAPLVGGKGGGKPDNARGGGKDPTQLDAALAHARSLIG